jgi:hypothetical protein
MHKKLKDEDWDFDSWTLLPCEQEEMDGLERSLIRDLEPLYNKRRF